MSRIREIIAGMPVEQREQIIREHEELEKEGRLGDALIRDVAAEIFDQDSGMTMTLVAQEVYRQEYHRLRGERLDDLETNDTRQITPEDVRRAK